MNANLLNVVNRIVAEQGEGILADAKRLFPFFADYAKNEYKEERVAFGRCIEYGAYQALKNTRSADARLLLKATLVDQINTKTGVDRPRCADAIDLLEAVIFKGEQQIYTSPSKAKLCSKCGKELQEGWTACPYCSAPVAHNACAKCGKELQEGWTSCPYCSTPAGKVEMQTSWQGPTPTAEMPKNIKKLLLIAVIIAPVLWFALLAASEFDVDYLEGALLAFVPLLTLVIATMLNVLGQRKNSRKMILAAGIVYSISFPFGIPSAVLCFIAFAKMKKINKEK
jgi:DNA-directed RNA polymerase subunit RPC12/RpoP